MPKEIKTYDDLVKLIGKENADRIVLERIMILIAKEQKLDEILSVKNEKKD